MYSTQRSRLMAGLIATSFLALASGAALAQAGGAMPPPAVGVIQLQARPVPVVNELPGRIAATRTAEVRARVSGILQERVFQQGSRVKQGDVLFRIEPRLFRVRIDSAEAALQKAKAIQANARQQLERQKTLRERAVTSGVAYDEAVANLAQADADVGLAEAALAEARINLDYTEIRAPITGIIGGALVTEGALVTAEGASALALIQQVDPVYADFTQSAQELLALKRAVEQKTLASPAPGEARVELVMDDGTVYGQPGRLLFASASVEPTTGQVTLRAEFPNPKGDLLPGMYVRVRLEQAVRQAGVTVPQRAVVRTPTGEAQVYVLADDNTAQARTLTLGRSLGQDWVVEAGLNGSERIVVDGVQKVKAGAKVAPEPWQSASTEPTTTSTTNKAVE
jgi:membrane fusion protein (multidrug efflux system)